MSKNIIRISLLLLSTTYVQRIWCDMRDFNICHQDSSLNPADGILKDHTFPWLGFTQYIHVTTGLPHPNVAPRVVLIQKQFVIGTAADITRLPKNYKLGNIIFGDYEREEGECGISWQELKLGYGCPRAYFEVPPLDILPHPEYSRFGVDNSLVLIKLLVPMKSRYMVPLCLPTLFERTKRKKDKNVYLIDYISNVPNDFDTENIGKKTLKLFTHQACKSYQSRSKLGKERISHMLCTTGCGVRAGAPIIIRSLAGRFELMGLAVGGARCTNRIMRNRINLEPPMYIDVYPYLDWIVNVITAHRIPKSYPQHFQLVEGGSHMGTKESTGYDKEKCGWNGRTYMCGDLCFRSKKKQSHAAFFYMETFEVHTFDTAKVNVELQISAGIECTIVCARLRVPNRLCSPSIVGVGTYNITLHFETDWFPLYFFFSVGLYGVNSTEENFVQWIADRDKAHWHDLSTI